MIKTLKRKFIFTAMTAITILLLVLIGAINIINMNINNSQSERMMERIIDMEGMAREPHPVPDKPNPDSVFPFPPISEDNAMAARFFTVTLNEQGEIIHTHTERISAVSENEAEKMAMQIYKSGKTKGSVENFKYMVNPTHDNRTVIMFMDNSNVHNSIVSVLIISLIIGIICWILMLILVFVLSQKVIKPIAQNIEKQKNFVSNAGHEIKTPLAIIQSNTEAMELYSGENKWSKNIKNQIKRLNILMQNLLTLSKMDEPNIKLPKEYFSLNAVISEAVADFSEIINSKNLKAEIETEESNIYANMDSIINLVSILIDNAVKYTEENGSIHIKLYRDNHNIFFKIKNSFTEKPSDKPERLFERFYRGDEARTQSKGGCGIGLSAAGAIAEANNATIKAEYTDDTHIQFTVKFNK